MVVAHQEKYECIPLIVKFGLVQIKSDFRCENPCWPPSGAPWRSLHSGPFHCSKAQRPSRVSTKRPGGTGHDVGGSRHNAETRCVGLQLTRKNCFKSGTLLSTPFSILYHTHTYTHTNWRSKSAGFWSHFRIRCTKTCNVATTWIRDDLIMN